MLILIADAFDAALPNRLAAFGDVTDDMNRLAEAEVLLVRSKTKVTAEFLERAPRLQLVIRGGVGLDNIDQAAAAAKGVEVHNTAAASSIAVAELGFALMIALPNHIARADASMREGKWLKKELKRSELYRKTLGVVGMGRIGSLVADRARAFGMSVEPLDFRHHRGDEAQRARLAERLGRCHYVLMAFPSKPENREILDASLLAEFKDGAYAINVGRAECVCEADVAGALTSGKLAGYATDVWMTDPPEESPLLSAPNCVFTPHIGASTRENMGRIGDVVEEILTERVSA